MPRKHWNEYGEWKSNYDNQNGDKYEGDKTLSLLKMADQENSSNMAAKPENVLRTSEMPANSNPFSPVGDHRLRGNHGASPSYDRASSLQLLKMDNVSTNEKVVSRGKSGSVYDGEDSLSLLRPTISATKDLDQKYSTDIYDSNDSLGLLKLNSTKPQNQESNSRQGHHSLDLLKFSGNPDNYVDETEKRKSKRHYSSKMQSTGLDLLKMPEDQQADASNKMNARQQSVATRYAPFAQGEGPL